jgi:hypothetical protein
MVNGNVCGIFESVSYNLNYGTEPIHVLGKFNPVEIAVTSQEAVSLTCSGFRVVGNGPYGSPSVPTVQQLLALSGMTITVTDRQTNNIILSVNNCIATGYSGSYNAKATSKIQINYIGTTIADESQANAAPVDDSINNAVSFP